MGDLLSSGASGWPGAFWTSIDGARVGVASSALTLERQDGCKSAECVCYVRLSVDIGVERDGETVMLHVEDLYPERVIALLEKPLDAQAAERVRETIERTLEALDAERPVHNLVHNCIAPMRLFEPLLNALVAPSEPGTLAEWASEGFEELLAQGPLVQAQTEGWLASVFASEVRVSTDLRSHGQIKLIGEIQLEPRDEGARGGRWKSRATLVEPTLEWRERPEPEEAEVERAIERWRSTLAANLSERLARRGGPIMLSEITPELVL